MSNKENTKEEEIKDVEQESQVEQNLEEVKKELTPEELIQQEKDKYLRLFAEFENYKKRTSRERIELFKTASQELMTSLLPIMDDFDRGLSEIKKVKDKELLKGSTLFPSLDVPSGNKTILNPLSMKFAKLFDWINESLLFFLSIKIVFPNFANLLIIGQ